MIPRFRTLLLALAGIGLYACMENDKPASPASELKATGGARVQLPALPAGYLAKTGADSGSQAQALFALTITGSGMAPIHQSWYLTAGQPQSVYVGGIPAGNMRVFYGRLIRFDTAMGDTAVTHEGSDTAAIRQDSVSEVNLYLRRTVNGGGAHVCVEVEGWPSDSTCIHLPIVPNRPWFGGCWNVFVTQKGPGPGMDSLFRAKLRIEQWDTGLTAIVTWNSGEKDSASGYVDARGAAFIGYRGGSEFMINAELDTSMVDTTFNRSMRGWFNDSARGIYGSMNASEAPCDTFVEPPIDSSFGPYCFSVSQTPTGKKAAKGTLVLSGSGSDYWGEFNWSGYPLMHVNADEPLNGSLGDSAAIALHGVAPRGMDSAVGDTLLYRAVLKPGAAAFSGNLFAMTPAGWKPAGAWKGNRKACMVLDTLR